VNAGNTDLPKLTLHATAVGGHEFVFVDAPDPDASHSAQIETVPSPTVRQQSIKIEFCPFNRRNRYEVSFYLISNGSGTIYEIINYTTPHSVRLARAGDMSPANVIGELMVRL
jgi:hypothetical protein